MDGDDPVIEACREYLADKRCTLWQTFNLHDDLDKAARWLAAQVQQVAWRVAQDR